MRYNREKTTKEEEHEANKENKVTGDVTPANSSGH